MNSIVRYLLYCLIANKSRYLYERYRCFSMRIYFFRSANANKGSGFGSGPCYSVQFIW